MELHKEYILSKVVWQTLEVDRLNLLTELKMNFGNDRGLGRYDFDFDEDDLRRPNAYILGGRGNKIKGVYQLMTNGGCGLMPSISTTALSIGLMNLVKKGYDFIGICRVGQFHTSNCTPDDALGSGLSDLAQHCNKNAVLLSLGRNGMKLQKINFRYNKDWEYNEPILTTLRLIVK